MTYHEYINMLSEREPKISCERGYDLSLHTSMRVGGKAALAVFPKNEEELAFAVRGAYTHRLEFEVLGNATNILAPDGGYDGVIIRTGAFTDIKVEDNRIIAGAGASLNSIAQIAEKNSLAGFEFAYGIPGSFGGAVYMNAGAYGGQLSDVLHTITCYDISKDIIKKIPAYECSFSYRKSLFSEDGGYVILSAEIELVSGKREEIREKMDGYIAARKEKQPLEYPSCGSFFKRTEGYITSKLIDECGLKGLSFGGAQVSMKHAGFIINTGNATADDIKTLAEEVKKRVKEKTGVDIEREVEYL